MQNTQTVATLESIIAEIKKLSVEADDIAWMVSDDPEYKACQVVVKVEFRGADYTLLYQSGDGEFCLYSNDGEASSLIDSIAEFTGEDEVYAKLNELFLAEAIKAYESFMGNEALQERIQNAEKVLECGTAVGGFEAFICKDKDGYFGVVTDFEENTTVRDMSYEEYSSAYDAVTEYQSGDAQRFIALNKIISSQED